jgi:condensin complex subunit 1
MLLQKGLVEAVSEQDWKMAKFACITLQKLPKLIPGMSMLQTAQFNKELTDGNASDSSDDDDDESMSGRGRRTKSKRKTQVVASTKQMSCQDVEKRMRVTGEIINFLAKSLKSSVTDDRVQNKNHSLWYPFAEQAVNAIFKLHSKPEVVCAAVLRDLGNNVFAVQQNDVSVLTSSPLRLSCLFFTLGHVALKLLVHTEEVASQVKKYRASSSDKKAAAKTKKKSSKKKKGKADADKDHSDDGSENVEDAMEAELGMQAEVEVAEDNMLHQIAEQEIVQKNLLGVFGPLLVRVAANEGNVFSEPTLRESAVLAFCKICCISSQWCEKNLQLLFTILSEAPEPRIRANVIIAMGDLAFRFPNLIEPWTSHLYSRLRDEDVSVRKNALMVLTHLILNDMIKVKGQISEMAISLEDEDSRIKDFAGLFFTELSKKGNSPIYNFLPDMIGLLSANKDVSRPMFRRITKHLIPYINKGPPHTHTHTHTHTPDVSTGMMMHRSRITCDKLLLNNSPPIPSLESDKHTESLVDKLCHRLPSAIDITQQQDISFCLAQLSMSDKTIRSASVDLIP